MLLTCILTLGVTPRPHDIYLFAGLITGAVNARDLKFSFVFDDEETLNGRALSGALDVARVSVVHYGKIKEQYDFLPCGAILGRGVGPLLVVNGESNEAAFDPARETLTPGASATAKFLLDWWANGSVSARHLPPRELYAALCNRPGAQGVIEGEQRWTFTRDGLSVVADLGEAWEARTGYAVPLGVIAVQKTLGAAVAGTITAALVRSLEWADQNPDAAFALCRRYAKPDATDDALRAEVGLFVNDFAYDLGTGGAEALEFFFAEQRRYTAGNDRVATNV